MLNKSFSPTESKELTAKIVVMLKELLTAYSFDGDMVHLHKTPRSVSFIRQIWPLNKKSDKQ